METGGALEKRFAGRQRTRKKKVTPTPAPLPPSEPEISPEPAVVLVQEDNTDYENELSDLRDKWPELVEQCLVLQPALKRDLRDSWPVALSDTQLTIGFDPEFPGVMAEVKMLDHGGLHKLFSNLLGRSVGIEYQVMKTPVKWSHHAPETVEHTREADKPFTVENAGNDPEEWVKNESIRNVLEVFHGDIIEIQR